jgi:pyruvate formate lyase activating enzyme
MEREVAAPAAVANLSLEAASPFEMRVDQSLDVPELDARTALKTGDIGFVHSFTTGSAVDGPGLRLVCWTTACMFRCRYCHNPDTWTLSNGMPVTIERACEELQKYAGGLKRLGGGFTLSGGEPLMQSRFAARLLAAAKSMGVHTAIETNGLYGDRLSDEELAAIDLVILDMKAFTPDQHRRVTGADNTKVLDFCSRLAALRRPMWFRYVLVPGLTDDPEEIGHVADFAATLGVVQHVEVLPFHQMGRFKWERLGLAYTLGDTQPPTRESVDAALAIFRAVGLDAN